MRAAMQTAVISILAVCMLAIPFPAAFAESTSVECSGNGIAASYFSADLFSDSACTSNITALFIDGDVKYNSADVAGGKEYSVSTVSPVIPLYLKITASNPAAEFSVSAVTACTFGHASGDDDDADSSLFTAVFDSDNTLMMDTDGSTSVTLGVGIHSVALTVKSVSAVMSSAPNSLGLSILFSVEDVFTGTVQAIESKQISASGETVIVDGPTANSSIEEANSNNDSFHGDDPAYEFETAEAITMGTGAGAHTVYGVGIRSTDNNSNGIADSNGDVDLTLAIPSNVSFCIHVYGANGNDSRLRADIIIDGHNSFALFIYKNNYDGYVFKSGSGVVLKKASDSNINNYYTNENLWLKGTVIEIHFSDTGNKNIPKSLQADIIFWPTGENFTP